MTWKNKPDGLKTPQDLLDERDHWMRKCINKQMRIRELEARINNLQQTAARVIFLEERIANYERSTVRT